MWDACCTIVNSPSIVASLAAAAMGLCLLSKAVDDWQSQRVRQKKQAHEAARTSSGSEDR
jgi:hypothetical protein